MKKNHFSMHFSNNSQTIRPKTDKQPQPIQLTQEQAQVAAHGRFRMYTAMNDVLYTGHTGGGCSSCGNK
jgi:hypothetical protein